MTPVLKANKATVTAAQDLLAEIEYRIHKHVFFSVISVVFWLALH